MWHLPNFSQKLFINSVTHRRPGVLQIRVCVPLDMNASAKTGRGASVSYEALA